MDAKEFLIKNKVDTSYVETFCNKNGWGKINLEDLLNSFIEHYKQAQALQLQQTGVIGRSEQFSFADMKEAFDYGVNSGNRYDSMTFTEWISKR